MSHVGSYFRWVVEGSLNYQYAMNESQIRSFYKQPNGQTKESQSAVWVFKLHKHHNPSNHVYKGRVLIKITFDDEGSNLMENKANLVNWEDRKKGQGEKDFPNQIIIKNNEPSARGIGRKILQTLNSKILSIEKASKKEIEKAT